MLSEALNAVLQASRHAADAADYACLHDVASKLRGVTDAETALLVTTRALVPCHKHAEARSYRLEESAPWHAALAAQMAADLYLRVGDHVNVYSACYSAERWAKTASALVRE